MAAVLFLVGTVCTLIITASLPAQIPISWNSDGTVAQMASTRFVQIFLPVFMLAVVATMYGLAKWGGAAYRMFRTHVETILLAVVVMLDLVQALFLAAVYEVPVSVGWVPPIVTGALFIVVGLTMPRIHALSAERSGMSPAASKREAYILAVSGLAMAACVFLPANLQLACFIGVLVLGTMLQSAAVVLAYRGRWR